MTEVDRAPNRHGLLTSVMRAATPAAGPKVLRVGLVHRGKVIDERVVDGRDAVTIGPNERSTFVVTGERVPHNHRLFERAGEDYELCLLPGMTGRIATSTGTADLTTHAGTIRLSSDARGKISIGDHTILFQFVTPVPSAGKPQLPANVKSGMGEDAFRTSVIAAFSFLVHFGAVGSIYSDWLDPVVDDEVQTAQIVESMKQLPAPPPVEHPAAESATNSPAAPAREVAKSPSATGGGARSASAGAAGSRAMGDARAHQISGQLATLEMQVLVGLNGSSGPATNAVLEPGSDLPLGMLEKAAASADGVRGSSAGLDLGGGHGALRPGSIPRGFDPMPIATALVAMSAGSTVHVAPPPGNVSVPPPSVNGGAVANANAVVAAMAAGFRRCYNQALGHEDPNMRGTVRITARIGPNGEVLSTSASGGGNLSGTLIGCLRGRVASAQFAAPEGGGATLVIPVSLDHQ